MTLHDRFDTRINIQNLLSATLIAASLIAWAMHIESRVTALEEAKRADEHTQDQLYDQLKDVNKKLDRLIERGK